MQKSIGTFKGERPLLKPPRINNGLGVYVENADTEKHIISLPQ
jgi:hypothetical protein